MRPVAILVAGVARIADVFVIAILAAAAATVWAKEPLRDIGHLWQITHAGLPDSYIFGTIHVADPRVATVPPAVRNALSRARTLAVEMVPEAIDSRAAEFELMDAGATLSPLLRPEIYAKLRAELVGQGLPLPVIERLKPWAAMMKLGHANPVPAVAANLDAQLLQAGRERQLRILPLEMLDEQISAFDNIPPASQVALLEHAVLHRDALAATIEPTIIAWQSGDFRTLAPIAGAAYDPYPGMGEHRAALMKNIIDNRTVLMHHRLFAPLRAGRVFVAVGAMHLTGPRGLLAMLRADGYTLTPLW